jgi:peptidase E
MATRVLVIGGGGFLMERGPSLLDRHFLHATGKHNPRICFIPTASGDAEEFLAKYYRTFGKLDCRPSHLAFFRKRRKGSVPLDRIADYLLRQDAIYVGGGNTRSMLAVWREWGLDRVLRRAGRAGILLGGMSAGAICWFKSGATDSLQDERLAPLPGLGLLPGSCAPHFGAEPWRRRDFRTLILNRRLPAGLGIDDGAAVLFEGQVITQVVSAVPGATAYRVARKGDAVVEQRLVADRLSRR